MLQKFGDSTIESYTESVSSHPMARQRNHEDALTDRQLVGLIQKGVSWASESLVRRHYDKARGLAFQMCRQNADEAADLTQQAFMNALGGIDRFKGDASFKTWFYRILINTCLDARRKKRRWWAIFSAPALRHKDGHAEVLSPDAFPDEKATDQPEAVWRNHQLRRDINEAIEALPEQQRLVFRLKMLQEMSISEISQVLSLAPGTVKSHLFRATQSLRTALADWAGR